MGYYSSSSSSSSAASAGPVGGSITTAASPSIGALSSTHASQASIAKGKEYLEQLKRSTLFLNPEGFAVMAEAYNVAAYGSLLPHQPKLRQEEAFLSLRDAQSSVWAKEAVDQGELLCYRFCVLSCIMLTVVEL